MTLASGEPASGEGRLFSRSYNFLWLSSFAFYISFQLLLTALPLHARSLGAREVEIGLIFGLFAASAMVVRLPVGWLLDRFGRVPILAVGAIVFALSSAGYAFATTVAALLAIRLFHGIGMSSYNTAERTLVVDISPIRRRGTALSIASATNNIASGIAPAAGIALSLAVGFPTLFGISSGFAMLALLLCLTIAEPRHEHRALAARRSLRSSFHRPVVRPGIVLLALQITYGAVISFVPLIAVERGLSNPGLYFTAFAIASILAQSVSGLVADRFGRLAVIVPGLFLIASGLLAVATLEGLALLGAAALYGAGFGSTQPALFALGGDIAGPAERGAAMATLGLFLELGISSGSIAAGLLAGSVGLSVTFMAFAGVALAGMLLAAFGVSGRPASAVGPT